MVAREEREADVEKPNPVKHQRVLLSVLRESLHELRGELRPVDLRVDVVQRVPPVVERALVVRVVQHGVRQAEVAPRILRLHKRVLRPVPEHHRRGDGDERRGHGPERRDGVDRVEVQVQTHAPAHAHRAPGEEVPATALERVIRQLDPRSHHEAHPVHDPVRKVVALVRLRRAQILVPLVVVHVVHHDVVQPVRVAGDAEHRRDNDDVEPVHVIRQPEKRLFLEQALVRAVVHGEDEPLHVQHVEPEKIRRADQVRGGEHGPNRDERGVHRGHDVPVQPRDLHVAQVVQAALEEALHESGGLEVILLAGLVDIVEVHLRAVAWIKGWGRRTRGGASATVSARTSAAQLKRWRARGVHEQADARAGSRGGRGDAARTHAAAVADEGRRQLLLLLFGHAHGARDRHQRGRPMRVRAAARTPPCAFGATTCRSLAEIRRSDPARGFELDRSSVELPVQAKKTRLNTR